MLLLSSVSDIIRIVTASAVATIGVHASWVDNLAGAITPGRTNTNISTATTTTVVGSPAASTQRNLKLLVISNNHASSPCFVTLQHFDGTTSVDLEAVTLLAQESLVLTEEGEWYHYDATGAKYSYNGPGNANLGLTGTIAETHPRELVVETNTTMAASGSLNMQAVYLKAGQLVSSSTLWSATTAAGTPTHALAGLFDASRNLLATSADGTTTAWAANSARTFAMITPYRVPVSGIYYIGYFMTATTVPTLKGIAARAATNIAGAAPILQGLSSTGLTTALPNPAAAITVSANSFYASVS
jgi:hypothetical protein